MIPRSAQVKVMLQVLLFLGGAGVGVGAWVGRTYLFEPEGTAPKIERVDMVGLLHQDNRCAVLVLDVDLDRIGRLRAAVVDEEGNQVTKESIGVMANSWRMIFFNPVRPPDWKHLGSTLPWWAETLTITAMDSTGSASTTREFARK